MDCEEFNFYYPFQIIAKRINVFLYVCDIYAVKFSTYGI